MIRITNLVLFLFGLSLLVYPVIWIRTLSSTLNASLLTSTTTLAIILGGFALGSLLGHRLLKRKTDLAKALSASLITVAISASVLTSLLLSETAINQLFPAYDISSLPAILTLSLLFIIPTAAIGLCLPLFHAWLSALKQQHNSISSHFFFILSLGVATGGLLVGFALIPQFALDGTGYFIAVLNLLSALLILWIPSKTPLSAVDASTALESEKANHSKSLILVLFVSFFSLMGASITWLNFLGIYTSTTLYSFSAIIATIALGFALGAWVMQYALVKYSLGFKSLFSLIIKLFLALISSQILLSYMPTLYGQDTFLGELLSSNQGSLIALIILPSTLLLGSITTLSIHLYQQSADQTKSVGTILSVPLLGLICGLLTTYFWIRPQFGSPESLVVFSYIPLIALFFIIPKIQFSKHKLAHYGLSYTLIVALASTVLVIPTINLKEVLFTHQYRYINTKIPAKFVYVNEGQTGLISFIQYDDSVLSHLKRDGVPLSYAHNRLPYKGKFSDSMIGALPYLLQPNPTNALVLGFGSGNTARILANSDLDETTVVESEPSVIEAIRRLGQNNFMFLEDGRAEIELNDPRAFLSASQERYSIITSQSVHPWTSGSNRFYSTTFFELAKSRLSDDGVFAHTFSLLRIDTALFQSVLNTFYSVFPQGAVFSDLTTGEIILLGSKQPLILDFDRTTEYFEVEEVAHILRFTGFRNTSELPGYFLFSNKIALKASNNAPLITDDNLLMEIGIPVISDKLPQKEHDPYQMLNDLIKK